VIYVANDKMRSAQVASHSYYLIVAPLAMLPAWIASGAFTRDTGVRELLRTLVYPRNWGWQAIAFFFFPAISLIPAAVVHLSGGASVWPEDRGTFWSFAIHGAIFFLNNFLFTAVLEEPGWRGFLLPRLQQRFSPLLASLLVWLPWALSPFDFTGGVGRTWLNYVQIRVIFFIPITIILTWLYNCHRSSGNVCF
jgi:membrane protease YdiL (CAAX protease family)